MQEKVLLYCKTDIDLDIIKTNAKSRGRSRVGRIFCFSRFAQTKTKETFVVRELGRKSRGEAFQSSVESVHIIIVA